MDRATLPGDSRSLGPVPAAVYAAMLGATMTGQLAGMLAARLAVGRRVLWVPILFSVLLEAVVGARFGAARLGRPLTAGECGRVSAYYSSGLAAISLPLAVWTLSSSPLSGALLANTSPSTVIVVLGIAVAGFALGTVVRQGLMTALSRRRR